jgi:hypothetical protein
LDVIDLISLFVLQLKSLLFIMVKILAAVVSIFILATFVFAAPTGPFTGAATWSYEGLGACGEVSQDSDLVVGVSQQFFNSWP